MRQREGNRTIVQWLYYYCTIFIIFTDIITITDIVIIYHYGIVSYYYN